MSIADALIIIAKELACIVFVLVWMVIFKDTGGK